MTFTTADLWHALTDPAQLFGHFTYLLMTLSVLMRSIAWLRGLAIAGGIAKIVYRTVFVFDPVSIFWEALYVLINTVQLIIIWWENRPPAFSEEESLFVAHVAPGLAPAVTRALVRAGRWRDVGPGTVLTREGERTAGLVYVAAGTVRIERAGRPVATCAAGDFIGEMTYTSGLPATASAVAAAPTRILEFERGALARAEAARPVLRLALQASFNRNLIDKLLRSPPHPPVPEGA